MLLLRKKILILKYDAISLKKNLLILKSDASTLKIYLLCKKMSILMVYFWRNIPFVKVLKTDTISLKKHLLILKANAFSLKKTSFFTFHYSTHSPPSSVKQLEFHLNYLKCSCSTSQKTQCIYMRKSLRRKVCLFSGC